MNWIEKATEEILIESKIGWTSEREKIEAIILSHAPVIDACKIAWAIKEAGHISIFEVDKVEDIISDSIDLNITWVDGKAGGE